MCKMQRWGLASLRPFCATDSSDRLIAYCILCTVHSKQFQIFHSLYHATTERKMDAGMQVGTQVPTFCKINRYFEHIKLECANIEP